MTPELQELLDKTKDMDPMDIFDVIFSNNPEDAECNPADFPGMTPEELKLYEVAE